MIGVDLRDAEVIANLAKPEGRVALVEGVSSVAGNAIDVLIAGAVTGQIVFIDGGADAVMRGDQVW